MVEAAQRMCKIYGEHQKALPTPKGVSGVGKADEPLHKMQVPQPPTECPYGVDRHTYVCHLDR